MGSLFLFGWYQVGVPLVNLGEKEIALCLEKGVLISRD